MIKHGLTTRQIGRRPRMASLSTIHYWLRHHPDFRPQYAEACRVRDFMLCVQLHTVVGEYTPANFPAIKRCAAVIEKRRADMEPMVWRWDLGSAKQSAMRHLQTLGSGREADVQPRRPARTSFDP